MKFINKSGNTVFLDDIDLTIPFKEDLSYQDISLDDAKKSRSFRNMVLLKQFELVESGDSLFEKNFNKLVKNADSIPKKKEKEPLFAPKSDKIEVRIKGHFFEAGGYAKVNRNMAAGLNALGVKVQIDAITNAVNDLNEVELRKLSALKSPVSKDAICIDSIIPSFSNIGHGKYKILYTTIEACTIPKQFVEISNNYNEIWVTSDFCKEVLGKYDIKRPIYVIPDTVDKELYKEQVEPYQFNPSLKPFVFGSVFGWSYRKGYDALLKSYLREFNGDDPVSLLIVSRFQSKSSRSDIVRETIQKYVKEYGGKNPPHIARCNKVIPEKEMPSIYKAMNAYVLFSRGEGFGIPYAEASMCGVPVISTNHSGQTMFLNKENSTLVDIDELAEVQNGMMHVHYWDGQVFPKLTSEDFIKNAGKSLREVFTNYEKALKKNITLKSFLTENYNIGRVSEAIKSRLTEIWSK